MRGCGLVPLSVVVETVLLIDGEFWFACAKVIVGQTNTRMLNTQNNDLFLKTIFKISALSRLPVCSLSVRDSRSPGFLPIFHLKPKI